MELGPVTALALPAVHHQVVERLRAVHGAGQPVTLLHRLDDLKLQQQPADSNEQVLPEESYTTLLNILCVFVNNYHVEVTLIHGS